MVREKKDGSSNWKDICPICSGKGKFDILIQEPNSKNVTEVQSSAICEICKGTGLIPILQKPRGRIK